MSPLLNKISMYLFPENTVRIGVSFDRDRVQMTQVREDNGHGSIVDWIDSTGLTKPMFEGAVTDEATKQLTEIFTTIAERQEKTAPVSIALPDPVFMSRMLEFDDIPGRKSDQQRLVSWRLAREFNVDRESICCVFQSLGKLDNKHLMLGMALNKSWIESLKHAASLAGIVVSDISSGSRYQFNQWYAQCAGSQQAGGLVVTTTGYWTLYIWDDSGCMRLLRSRWFGNGEKTGLDVMAAEVALQIEQTIRAFSSSVADYSIGQIFIAGEKTPVDALASALDARMHRKSIVLAADRGTFSSKDEKIPVSQLLVSTMATVCES